MGSSAEVQVVDSDKEEEAAGATRTCAEFLMGTGAGSGQVLGGSAPAVAETAVDGTAVSQDEAVAETAEEGTGAVVGTGAIAGAAVGVDEAVAAGAVVGTAASKDEAVDAGAVAGTAASKDEASAAGAVAGTAARKDEAGAVTTVVARPGLAPALDPVRPVCEKCRFFVDPLAPSVRITKKNPQLWMCGSCNCNMVMMSRVADNFLEEFNGFSEEEKLGFMQLRGGLKEYKAK